MGLTHTYRHTHTPTLTPGSSRMSLYLFACLRHSFSADVFYVRLCMRVASHPSFSFSISIPTSPPHHPFSFFCFPLALALENPMRTCVLNINRSLIENSCINTEPKGVGKGWWQTPEENQKRKLKPNQ